MPSLVVRPGARLQKPLRGTIFRLSRSAIGIGDIRTAGVSMDFANTGAFGRNLSFFTRRRYSAERLSCGAAPALTEGLGGLWESFPPARSGGSRVTNPPAEPEAFRLLAPQRG